MAIGGLLLLTFLAYLPSLSNDFVNWDDGMYINENRFITSVAQGRIGEMFALDAFVGGNYHPLTVLSLGIDYAIGGLEPATYHWTNLLFHLLNTALVFLFVFRLADQKFWAALISGFFFALHPMHVESVAWATGRKDVLYLCFFMLGLLLYLRYLEKPKIGLLAGVLGLFVLSSLSKPAAVVFPFALMLIDYYKDRKVFSMKVLLEKAPFFLVALLVGLMTLKAQGEAGAIVETEKYTIIQKGVFACYGLMMYLVKAVVPFQLAPFHPFPSVSDGLPFAYWASPVIVLLVAGLTAWSARKTKVGVFGMLFFLANLVLVLQIIGVGSAIIAERYTYLPYVGLFFIVGMAFEWLWKTKEKKWQAYRMPAAAALLFWAAAFTYLTYEQTKVWENGGTLWTKAIASHPISRCYDNRGSYYRTEKQYDKALADFNTAVTLNSEENTILNNRGTLLFDMKRYDEAMADFDRALAIEEESQTYVNRGSVYGVKGNFQQAIKNFNRAVELDDENAEAFVNRAILHSLLKNDAQSEADYKRHLQLRPADPDYRAFNGLGVIYFNQQKYKQALPYFDKALAVNTDDGQTWFNRSQCHLQMGDKAQALRDAQQAQAKGYQVQQSYLDQFR
jgi:tetratricopeptide (TPR) repeat protein